MAQHDKEEKQKTLMEINIEPPAGSVTDEEMRKMTKIRDAANLEALSPRGPEYRDQQITKADSANIAELYKAAMKGKWQDAKAIFRRNENAKTTKISDFGMTAFHVAATCGRSEFVVEMVKELSKEQLEATDKAGFTALHYVALTANVEAAKAMVEKNPDLPHLGDKKNLTPLFYAAKWRHPEQSQEMVDYLYRVTENIEPCYPFTGGSAADLIVAMTASGSYETALRTLKKYPELALRTNDERMSILKKNDERMFILHVLAMQPLAFRSGHALSTWESCIYNLVTIDMEETEHEHVHSPTSKNRRDAAASFFKFKSKFTEATEVIRKVSKIKERHQQALGIVVFVCEQLKKEDHTKSVLEYFIPNNHTPVLHLAIEQGAFELVEECLNHFPDLIWYPDRKTNLSLLHAAVEHRQLKIFHHIIDLIGNNTKAFAELQADGGNNILHLAAKLAPAPQLYSVPGPAFQMQREFQWFKINPLINCMWAVEARVYYDSRIKRNNEGQTPRELFFHDHENLQKDAKEWVRDTLNSGMVAATLVATVAFAAIITVPGGNESETGIPVFARKKLFTVFAISNALSRISSVASLLMFLSLQTSRYTEDDFLESVPKTLLRGLVYSSIAVVFMMISFATAIGLPLEARLNRVYIPITIVASFPAIIFASLQLPVLLRKLIFPSGPFSGEQRDRKFRCLSKIGYRRLADDMA